jgi:SagB-type dehydrogenase family enzyme
MTHSGYETILAYHEATKHQYHRYARSAGAMEWANQPNPYRYYEGTEKTPLPLGHQDPALSYEALFSPLTEAGQALSMTTLSCFLSLSMGLSAWKKAGNTAWALRINPSSGNLHPTELHLVIPPVPDLKGGVYHYFSFEHALERRSAQPQAVWRRASSCFGGPGFLVALSTIFWRESWKYGERAYRYCNLDVGHAVASLAIAARLLGWRLTCLTGTGDEQAQTLLGFDRTPWHPLEEEIPQLVCWISLDATSGIKSQSIPQELISAFAESQFYGCPNPLSRSPVDWSIISKASTAAGKTPTTPTAVALDRAVQNPISSPRVSAAQIIRQRRSAVKYDPRRSIPMEVFQSMLHRTLALQGIVPFSAGLMPPSVHLLIFAHRITGLAPGLYVLVRRQPELTRLKSRWRRDFLWQPLWPELAFYRLKAMDVTMKAIKLSCYQQIAGQSAFAVAMIAHFDNLVRQAPYYYRYLHWECGMIGQVLYLEAEAHGIRGTGIGCFFDDPVHQLIGVEDNTFQSLYHFTVGHPIEDTRLETLAPYHHLDRLVDS